MDLAIQLCSYLVGLPLEVLAITALLRGGYRRYPLVFAYAIAYFLTSVLEMPFSVIYYLNKKSVQATEMYTWLYYRDEAVLQALVFILVISLLYQATSRLPSRRTVRLVLIAGAVLFAGISFVVHYDPAPKVAIGLWVTPWLSNLKFCAAILDLVLWALLIASREKDQRLLMVTCALGIMFAGEAIGESLRHLASSQHSRNIAVTGSVLVLLSNLAFLFIWWRAFRSAKPPAPAVSEMA